MRGRVPAGGPSSNPFTYDPAQAVSGAAWPRLLSLLLASAASGLCPPLLLLLPATASIGALLATGERPRDIVRGSRILLPLAVFVLIPSLSAALRGQGELRELLSRSLVHLARLAAIMLLARVFYRTNSTQSVADAMSSLARLFPGKNARHRDPGLYLGLAVAFLPRCFERSARVREAALARGYARPARQKRDSELRGLRDHRGSRPGLAGAAAADTQRSRGSRPSATSIGRKCHRLRALAAIVETTVISLLGSAVTTAWALEARGYTPARSLSPGKPRPADLAILAASALFAIISIFI